MFYNLNSSQEKTVDVAFSKNKLLLRKAGGRKEILNIIDNVVLSDSEFPLIHTDIDSTAQGLTKQSITMTNFGALGITDNECPITGLKIFCHYPP